jgi:hypothetical protein
MGVLRIYQGKSKPAKKKPGWQKEKAAHDEWLARVNATTLGITKPKAKTTKKIDPVVKAPVVNPDRLKKAGPSIMTPGDTSTKPVARPEILYKDDPEMLKRELTARERRFATAPAYNKGGDVLVTDELMKDITAGKTRRR